MFVLVGLPVEEEAVQPTEKQIEEEYGISPVRIFLPSFTGVSLEAIVNQVEGLTSLEKGCEGLLRLFAVRSSKDGESHSVCTLAGKLEDMKNTFRWDSEYFMSNSIDKAMELLNKEYSRINEAYSEKTDEFGRIKREHEELQRMTRGSLCDINLNIIVDKQESYEFLKVLYVVVQKEKEDVFRTTIEESPLVSSDAVERINSDEEYVLFKMYVLHHNEEEVTNMMNNGGFMLRTLDKNLDASGEITARRRRVEEKYVSAESGLATFIHIHLIEIFKIMVHVKLLKLFVESVYRYGLPTEYVFFVTKGSRTKVLRQWNAVARDWPSDRVIYEEEENDENDMAFAFSEIDICGGDEV